MAADGCLFFLLSNVYQGHCCSTALKESQVLTSNTFQKRLGNESICSFQFNIISLRFFKPSIAFHSSWSLFNGNYYSFTVANNYKPSLKKKKKLSLKSSARRQFSLNLIMNKNCSLMLIELESAHAVCGKYSNC